MNDKNQHSGTGRLGVEPKFFNEETPKPFARLFAIMNESYEKDGNKIEKTLPVNIVLSRKADVELVHKAHTGTPISWTGKLSLREYEVAGEKRTAVDVIIAGPGAKLEVSQPKVKAADAIGERQKQATAPAHNQ